MTHQTDHPDFFLCKYANSHRRDLFNAYAKRYSSEDPDTVHSYWRGKYKEVYAKTTSDRLRQSPHAPVGF